VYLVKTDSNGKKQRERSIGGTRDDIGYSVQQTSDGGYIIIGSSTDPLDPLYKDLLLIKTDGKGKSKTTSFDNLWFERLF
jgi:basic membrane lipoprotein Med (substrate-binding protein (PBP1-ABC) superfamily)